MKPLKAKTCKACGKEYQPRSSISQVCSPPCALQRVREKAEDKRIRTEAAREKAKRLEAREQRSRLKTRSDWLREAQAVFNRYIRARDKGKACISCGKHHSGQQHAGHYLTTKAAGQLRFHPWNCHLQCAPCNNHLSGNILEYRINLVKLRGQDAVDFLEGPHEIYRWTIEDAKEIKSYYRGLLKQLETDNGR